MLTQDRDALPRRKRIKVVGVGGGGGKALNRMIDAGMKGTEFIAADTDMEALKLSQAPLKLQLGARLTSGLGAGGNPDVGRMAALEDSEKIIEALEGADIVFVTAGLGGGTGTGAAPVIASLASELGILTVAVITRPFAFEGKRRLHLAERGMKELIECADMMIVIPNEKLLVVAQDAGFFESFHMADDVLRQGVQGISDIIDSDFGDVKTAMAGMGSAVMGTAVRSGENRAIEAVQAAMASPLLDAGAIDSARGILINITGSSSLNLKEINQISSLIQSVAHEDAKIVFGSVLDEKMGEEVKITVIATGFRDQIQERRARMLSIEAAPVVSVPVIAPEDWLTESLPAPAPEAEHFLSQGADPEQDTAEADVPVLFSSPAAMDEGGSDLDIPCFMRRMKWEDCRHEQGEENSGKNATGSENNIDVPPGGMRRFDEEPILLDARMDEVSSEGITSVSRWASSAENDQALSRDLTTSASLSPASNPPNHPDEPDHTGRAISLDPGHGAPETRNSKLMPAAPLESFRCSAFYPERIEARSIGKIIAGVHLESVASEVVREAARRLGLPKSDRMKAVSQIASIGLPRQSSIEITVDVPGLAFENTRASLCVWEDQQLVEFRFKPMPSSDAQLCRGWVHFWFEGIVLADASVTILVEVNQVPEIFRDALAESNARPYRFVFPSYSHEDKEVVERLESYAEAFGDTYLRDVRSLRAGQEWNEELRGFIKRAHVFQLFWSDRAAGSKYVRSEWQCALSERSSRPDPYFVRPIYWSESPAEIPLELEPIHFAKVPLSKA
jgi:cell division protein FtsZ